MAKHLSSMPWVPSQEPWRRERHTHDVWGAGVRGSWQHKNQPFGNSLKATEALFESPTPTPASSMLGISAIGDTSSLCSVLGSSLQPEARAVGSQSSSILPTHEAFPITAQGRPLMQNTFPECPLHTSCSNIPPLFHLFLFHSSWASLPRIHFFFYLRDLKRVSKKRKESTLFKRRWDSHRSSVLPLLAA